MRILMISSDPKLMDPNSAVRKRVLGYADLFDCLHVFLVSRTGGYKRHRINEKLSITAFSSALKFPGLINAIMESREYKNKFDYITSQDPFELGLAGFLISKIVKAKLQIQIHTDISSKYFIFQNPINFFRYLVYRFLIGRAHSIRTVSSRIKDEISKYKIKGSIFVLPIFVDVERLEEEKTSFNVKEKYPKMEQIVLMVSRLTIEKDFDTALKTFRRVVQKHPRTGLVIVGDGPKKPYIKTKAKTLGIGNNVFLEGFNSDIVSYFKTSDIYLLTSRYEGYSMSLVEAAALRIPIVSTDVGIVGSYLTNDRSALVCPVGDSECLAQKVSILIENKDLARSLYMEAARSVSEKTINKYNYLEKFKETFV